MAQKKEVELKATLEILDADEHEGRVDDDSPNRRQLKLSPEEVARLEAEKALLLSSLRGGIPERPVTITPPSVSDEPIVVPTSPALQAATAAVDEADAELQKLADEQKALDRERADALKVEAENYKFKLEAFRQKRDAAEAETRRLRQVAAGVELAARVQIQEQEALRERERQKATANEARTARAARIQPLIDQAVAVRADLQVLAQHRPTLDRLAKITWQETPAAWPSELRIEYNNTIPSTAERLLCDLDISLQACARLIPLAEGLISADSAPDGQHLVQTLGSLADLNSDLIRSLRERIADLNAKLDSIQQRGEHVRPGQAPLLPSVVADENRALGLTGKERAMRDLGITPGEAAGGARLQGEEADAPGRKQSQAVTGKTGDIFRI